MNSLTFKMCSECGVTKAASEFYSAGGSRRSSYCKPCDSLKAKKRYLARRLRRAVPLPTKTGSQESPIKKHCPSCKSLISISKFSTKGKGRYQTHCKSCRAASKRKTPERNKVLHNRRKSKIKGAAGFYNYRDVEIKLKAQKGRPGREPLSQQPKEPKYVGKTLKDVEVEKVRELLTRGLTNKSIALMFGVSKACISHIKTGRTRSRPLNY